MLRKLLCFIMALAVSAALAVTAYATPDEVASVPIRAMLNAYLEGQEGAGREVQCQLERLEDLDAAQARAWRRIMAKWKWIDSRLELRYDVLPQGLAQDDSLGIVIMGYGLNPDGSAKPELKARLKVALASWERYPNAFFIVTGGATARNSDATEAGVMAAWLAEHGIPQEQIITDHLAYSTAENALNVYGILTASYPQVRSLAVITSDYHIYRSYLDFVTVSEYSAAVYGTPEIRVVSHACCDTWNRRESLSSYVADIAYITGVTTK